jgi:hypothetical protein
MYEKGTLSPVEVAQASLNCAERCINLNVFVRPPDREQVFVQARQSEARWHSKSSLGKLDGVPITVKDTILAKGWPTFEACRPEPAMGRRCACSGKRAREGSHYPWQDDHAGIRLERRDRFPSDGHHPKSLEPGTDARRLERRFGRSPGRRHRSRSDRNRCCRIGSHSRSFLWARGAEGIAWTHSSLSAKSPRNDGACWSDLPNRGRCEPATFGHLPSRPARLECPASGPIIHELAKSRASGKETARGI